MKTITNFANNQVMILNDNENEYKKEFFSYGTKICEMKNNKILISNYWNFSKTTIKYLCQFLGYSNKKTILQAIEKNLIKVVSFPEVSKETLNKEKK